MLSGEGFFDRPWPSNKRTIDGAPDLSDFPFNGDENLLAGFLDVAAELDGFGTNSPIYMRFTAPINTNVLPAPIDSATTNFGAFLVNVDPNSPARGALTPFSWDFQEDETTWQPTNLLAIQPVWGFPLDPDTTYAMVVTTDLAAPADGFSDIWWADHPEQDSVESLQETLISIRVPLDTVAAATVFTTQNPTRDLVDITGHIRNQLIETATDNGLLPLDQELRQKQSTGYYTQYEGVIHIPLWQHGEKPYSSEGGGFLFNEQREPILGSWEATAFTLTIPNREDMPEQGWPVVIYSHGTGGSHTSVTGGSPNSPATILAMEGMASFAISQPLHGDRGNGINAELYSFNYLNPTAGQTMFRQGALDQIYLAEILTSMSHSFSGGEHGLDTDPTRLGFLGHSHGGEVGSMAAAFFGDRVDGVVLSGAGGGLSVTLVERDAGDFDIETLIRTALDFSNDEVLRATHPVVGLVQMVAETTDPINYAPYWHAKQATWDNPPVSVLETEGLSDIYTPPNCIEALAAAAGNPIFTPVEQLSTAHEINGMYDEAIPTSGNLTAWDGSTVSGGLSQYADDGHFAIFNNWDAAQLYQVFLRTALNGEPPLITEPDP